MTDQHYDVVADAIFEEEGDEPTLAQLEKLAMIYGMFEKPKAADVVELSKQVKQSPSGKIADKFIRYETHGAADDDNVEQPARTDSSNLYTAGIQFNEVRDAKEKFEKPNDLTKQPIRSVVDVSVPKGKTGDIRDFLETTAAKEVTDPALTFLNDQQWTDALTADRIDQIFEKISANISSLEKSDDLTATLDKLIKQLKSDELSSSRNSDCDDCRWFVNLNERRLSQLVKNAMTSIGIDPVDGDDDDVRFRAIVRPIMKSVRRVCRSLASVKKHVPEIHVPHGLASSRIEQILQSTAKEFQRQNSSVDLEVVDGMTNLLRSQILDAMVSDKRLSASQQAAATPGKLSDQRMNQLIEQIEKTNLVKGSSGTSVEAVKGMLEDLRSKIMLEMTKSVDAPKTVTIDVDSGVANLAKERIIESMMADNVKRAVDTSTIEVPTGFAKEQATKFTGEQQDSRVGEWECDVPLEKGSVRDRKSKFDAESEKFERGEWVCDIPIDKGAAKSKSEFFDQAFSKSISDKSNEWVPDVPMEAGHTKSLVQNMLSQKDQEKQRSSTIELNNEVKSGLTKERANLFQNLEQLATTAHVKPNSRTDLNIPKSDGRRLDVESLRFSENAVEMIARLNDQRIQPTTLPFHTIANFIQRQRSDYSGSFENEPIPSDPNIAREEKLTQSQINITHGYTKLMMERLKDSYEKANTVSNRVDQDDLGLEPNHAKNLKEKWGEHEKSAVTIKTAAEKTTYVPKRFVAYNNSTASSNPKETRHPSPDKVVQTPVEPEPVSEPIPELKKICIVCKKPTTQNKLIAIDDKDNNAFAHPTCMRCAKCYTKLEKRNVVIKNNKIWCKLHVPVTLTK